MAPANASIAVNPGKPYGTFTKDDPEKQLTHPSGCIYNFFHTLFLLHPCIYPFDFKRGLKGRNITRRDVELVCEDPYRHSSSKVRGELSDYVRSYGFRRHAWLADFKMVIGSASFALPASAYIVGLVMPDKGVEFILVLNCVTSSAIAIVVDIISVAKEDSLEMDYCLGFTYILPILLHSEELSLVGLITYTLSDVIYIWYMMSFAVMIYLHIFHPEGIYVPWQILAAVRVLAVVLIFYVPYLYEKAVAPYIHSMGIREDLKQLTIAIEGPPRHLRN